MYKLKPCPFCGAEGNLFSHEMDGSAAPEPKVLKLAALADQRKTM